MIADGYKQRWTRSSGSSEGESLVPIKSWNTITNRSVTFDFTSEVTLYRMVNEVVTIVVVLK